ncbi:MAG: hypothetical protein HY909_04040 [Deltaproteobacteria bacterium]|nr:hypothetical protein [Deltaproteobacteria bacterium]
MASCSVVTRAAWGALVAVCSLTPSASAQGWTASAAAGTDRWFAPELGGQAFLLFDLRGAGVVGGGDFRAYYNTETAQVGVERVPLGTPRLQLSAWVRAEGALAGILRYYGREGRRDPSRGFFASYAGGAVALKWLPAEGHSLELVAAARAWLFAREQGVTDATLALPADTWALEPRARYTFWGLDAAPEEYAGHVLFPRYTGFAAGVELGVDARSARQDWGAASNAGDLRNRPASAIVQVRQWARAGVRLGSSARVQVEESASWGEGEDDLTRVRVGGMNPYAVSVPGLSWPGLLCERYAAGLASVHVRPSQRYPHELGVMVGGGAFNDVRRTGALAEFGGAVGTGAFVDLRFGRWVAHLRAGYALPLGWLADGTHLGVMATMGVRLF